MFKEEAYNLKNRRKKFMKMLKSHGFSYDTLDDELIYAHLNTIVGRILNTNPPYLIIDTSILSHQVQENAHIRDSVKRLSKLAREFVP